MSYYYPQERTHRDDYYNYRDDNAAYDPSHYPAHPQPSYHPYPQTQYANEPHEPQFHNGYSNSNHYYYDDDYRQDYDPHGYSMREVDHGHPNHDSYYSRPHPANDYEYNSPEQYPSPHAASTQSTTALYNHRGSPMGDDATAYSASSYAARGIKPSRQVRDSAVFPAHPPSLRDLPEPKLTPPPAYSSPPPAAWRYSMDRKRKGSWMCCGCCPFWVKFMSCACCLLIVAAAIAIGVIAATFKKPDIKFKGVIGHPGNLPPFELKGSGFSINVGLDVEVANPNFLGAFFPQIEAQAYYPNPTQQGRGLPVGGGTLKDVNIPAHSVTPIKFPFSIEYNPTAGPNQFMLQDIASKCGFLGSARQQLKVDYDLKLTVKVLFLSIPITLPRDAQFDCPIKEGSLPNLGQIGSLLGKGGGG
ncbi:uncharacterized protein VTP21DRAFT_2487 [Calcarisporiella thermophila]|uniref:uncharacterized protein n=1 Tax=Calcarisporiella thermophila TaxID=911321 RepID=UPI003744563D